MNVRINDVDFIPYRWEMFTDGIWGQIFFIVKKGTFKKGSNNGAYCTDAEFTEEEKYFSLICLDEYDMVYVATPCMDQCGENLGSQYLVCILNEAASYAYDNLCPAE